MDLTAAHAANTRADLLTDLCALSSALMKEWSKVCCGADGCCCRSRCCRGGEGDEYDEDADEEDFVFDFGELHERARQEQSVLRIESDLLTPLHEHAHEEPVLLAGLRHVPDRLFEMRPLVERIGVQTFLESARDDEGQPRCS